MNIATILATAVLALAVCAPAHAQAQAPERVETPRRLAPVPAPVAVPWSVVAAKRTIYINGWVDQGPDTAREETVVEGNLVMRNGLVVPWRTGWSPARRAVLGTGRYATDLDVAGVEVIIRREPITRRMATVVRDNLGPDELDLNRIELTLRLVETDARGRGTEIARRSIAYSPARRMSYGVWAPAELPRRFEPPQDVRTAPGSLVFRLLSGPDDIKDNPASVAVLVDTPAGPQRDDRLTLWAVNGRNEPKAFGAGKMWNHERSAALGPWAFRATTEPTRSVFRWGEIGRVGLFYRYGEHGLDRDDWDVSALFVDFCPDFLQRDAVCFRKSTHYSVSNPGTPRARLNGDGAGTEVWEPFY